VFNVGTGKSVTINALWRMIASLSGTGATPVHGPPRPGDVPHSVAGVDGARAALGFAPQVSLEEGLKTTMDWYRISAFGEMRSKRDN
jgi:UDP-glucose 4-epimerase